MIDLFLRATDESTLAASLPMLRTEGDDAQTWATASPWHALDVGVPIVETPPVVGPEGDIVTEAIFAAGFHANLRLLDGHPDYSEILAAAAPFEVTPAEPKQGFAASEDAVAPVPPVISDRQFAQVLALDGVITEAEALAWAARGELPSAMVTALQAIPEEGGARFGAEMLLSAATTYERAHPLVGTLGVLLGRDGAALDDIWRRGAAL